MEFLWAPFRNSGELKDPVIRECVQLILQEFLQLSSSEIPQGYLEGFLQWYFHGIYEYTFKYYYKDPFGNTPRISPKIFFQNFLGIDIFSLISARIPPVYWQLRELWDSQCLKYVVYEIKLTALVELLYFFMAPCLKISVKILHFDKLLAKNSTFHHP